MVGPIVLACLTAVFLAALRYGGGPERLLAGLMLLIDVVDHFQHRIFGPADFVHLDPGHFTLDSITLVGMMWVALRANRMWPLPACSLQLVSVSGHFAVSAPLAGLNQAYWAMSIVPGWLQTALVIVGIFLHAKRNGRFGHYRDWRLGLSAFSGSLIYPGSARAAG